MVFDKDVEEELAKDFFKVEGATVTAVAPGEEANVYLLTVEELTKGTVKVNDVESKPFDFTEVEPEVKAEVEEVKVDNYRHIVVTFNQKVDKKSAADPANYYFDIVEGNAKFGAPLKDSLQLKNLADLSKFSVTKDTKTLKWWDIPEHITAEDIDNKTVVNIYLPDDVRFTNNADEKATLEVLMADGTKNPLVKNSNVKFAVRNVRDIDEKTTIDTFVTDELIIDKDDPKLVAKYRIEDEEEIKFENEVTLKNDGSDKVLLEFDEPVVNPTAFANRQIKVVVNGKEVPAANLKDVLTFKEAEYDTSDFKAYDFTYSDSKTVELNVKEAATKVTESYKAGDILAVSIIGITDTAANIMVPSTISFNVKVKDAEVEDPKTDPTIKPVVKDVVQVADNIFRVEFNVKDATGEFIIVNADGKNGDIKVKLPLSKEYTVDKTKVYYSYVEVPAVETATDSATETELVYNGQDYINREIRVENPWTVNVPTTGDTTLVAQGDNKNFGLKTIKKDIDAPVVVDLEKDIKYAEGATKLVIDLEDVIPEGVARDFENKVQLLKYKYESTEFKPNVVDSIGEYLPIKVSYVTEKEATRTALVSNKTDLKDNPGVAGSIAPAATVNAIEIELKHYKDLLNKDGELVPGAKYTIEIPKGYFADPGKEVVQKLELPTEFQSKVDATTNLATAVKGATLTLTDSKPAAAYVSAARNEKYGYTSNAVVVIREIGKKSGETEDPEEDAVPQTSKSLIKYDSVKNEMWVEFTGQINVDTLKNPANYELDGKTLEAWGLTKEDIKYVETLDADGKVEHQYAVFTLPENSIKSDGDVKFVVSGVTNDNDAMMTPVETIVSLLDNTRPEILKGVVKGQREIELVFDEPVYHREDAEGTAIAKNFEIMAGDVKLTVLNVDFTDGERVVKLVLGSDIPVDGEVTVKIVKDGSDNILIIDSSVNKNPMAEKTYTIDRE